MEPVPQYCARAVCIQPTTACIDTRAGIFKQSMGARNRVGKGLSYRPAVCGIFKLLRSPGIDFASLCILAGRYDNPIPTPFLAPLYCYKIPAQAIQLGGIGSLESIRGLLKSKKFGLSVGRWTLDTPLLTEPNTISCKRNKEINILIVFYDFDVCNNF
jgi:hypothetical protein